MLKEREPKHFVRYKNTVYKLHKIDNMVIDQLMCHITNMVRNSITQNPPSLTVSSGRAGKEVRIVKNEQIASIEKSINPIGSHTNPKF